MSLLVHIFQGGFYNKDKPILKDGNLKVNLSYFDEKISNVNFFPKEIESAQHCQYFNINQSTRQMTKVDPVFPSLW